MKPQVLVRELGLRLRGDAIVACDSGTITTWWARHIPARRGRMHSVSGNLATMACGHPYAIAAPIAHPDRQVVAFVGDGGSFLLMAEFAICVKYGMVFLGTREHRCDLDPIDFALFARACGGQGFTIENPAEAGPILAKALATPGPVIVEGIVDPFEPPTPAKITADQALHFATSLLRGEPNRAKIALTVLADKVRQLV